MISFILGILGCMMIITEAMRADRELKEFSKIKEVKGNVLKVIKNFNKFLAIDKVMKVLGRLRKILKNCGVINATV